MERKDDFFVYTDIQDDEPIRPHEDTDTDDRKPLIEEISGITPEDAPTVETTPLADEPEVVATNDDDLDEFAAPAAVQTVVEPSFNGTADALTATKKVYAPVTQPSPEIPDEVAITPQKKTDEPTAAEAEPAEEPASATQNTHPLMRFLGGIVPHVGDSAFDIIRKCIMLVGILVFVGAATYLIDDLILIPIHNDVLVESLQQLYTPDGDQELSEAEQNFNYPPDLDPAFKKLYYQNSDIRGWLSYKTTDGTTFNIDYPVVQSPDNDYYLFHDFNRTYNKNGTLFFDYRNDLTSKASRNRNTVIYGHNMASGQMLAGLNKLLWGVGYARVAPTFTMNTIYNKAEYKVFAVMLLNNNSIDGIPFNYLRTSFNDNIDFAGFLSEITARSLYNYGDVDVRPDDDIVMLSTCTDWDLAHFKDGRTVVVARKVRPGEAPTTDAAKITVNEDVVMPYGWYINQKFEPHPYYTDPMYFIQPLDTLMDFLATSTAPDGQPTTSFTLFQQDGTFGIVLPTTMTDANGNIITQHGGAVLMTINVESTPVYYSLGSGFDYDNTKVVAVYSDGKKVPINSKTCAVVGFDSSKVGTCEVALHYGAIIVKFKVNIVDGVVAPLNTTTKAPTTTTRPANFIPYDPNAKKTSTTVVTTTTTETTTTETTVTETTTTVAETTTTTEAPAVVSDDINP